jgi:hypothetical protein
MKVLIACEESQATCKEFRKLGHEAYSCDLLPCSGKHKEWHIQGDAIKEAYSGKYQLMIAHPPCTYLAVSGARWLYNKDKTKNQERWNKQEEALDFVRKLMNAPIKHIALENPISVISSYISQIVQPYMFGAEAHKSTCLWLKNLPLVKPTNIVGKGEFIEFIAKDGKKKRQPKWYFEALKNAKTTEERRTLRSKTFTGMAKAFAEQWGNLSNYHKQTKLEL